MLKFASSVNGTYTLLLEMSSKRHCPTGQKSQRKRRISIVPRKRQKQFRFMASRNEERDEGQRDRILPFPMGQV